MGEKEIIVVPKDITPVRLDVYLVKYGLGLSRSQIQKGIRNGNIIVVGKGTKPNFILRGGEIIEVKIPKEEPLRAIPQNIPLNIVYEDDYLLVVDKPAGMVTHPARGAWDKTLLNALLYHIKELSNFDDPVRAGIVHRLDKDTSGLILVAKREDIQLILSRAISERKIKREYFAIVWGRINSGGTVDAPIGRSPNDPTRMAVVQRGRRAVTHYEVIANYDFLTSLKINLETGRTHQIRVHMWYIGHPVFGDPQYGGREERIGGIHPKFRDTAKKLLSLISRQALHAQKLLFFHPVTGLKMEFFSPLPPDLASVVEFLEKTEN